MELLGVKLGISSGEPSFAFLQSSSALVDSKRGNGEREVAAEVWAPPGGGGGARFGFGGEACQFEVRGGEVAEGVSGPV